MFSALIKRHITLWNTDLQKKHMQHSPVDKMMTTKPAVKKRQTGIGL